MSAPDPSGPSDGLLEVGASKSAYGAIRTSPPDSAHDDKCTIAESEPAAESCAPGGQIVHLIGSTLLA